MDDIFQMALQTAMAGQIKQKELAAKVNISVSYFNDLYRGRKSGQESVRRTIAKALGYDDYETFLDIGRRKLGLRPLRTGAPSVGKCWPEDLADFFRVPFSDHMRLAAGGGSIEITEDENSSAIMVHGPSLGRTSGKNLQAFRVGGDSMEPLIAKGGIVLADLSQNEVRNFHEGRIYVLSWDVDEGECAVKRLKWAEKKKLLAIESENACYETAYRRPTEVRLIGQVIWSWRDHK